MAPGEALAGGSPVGLVLLALAADLEVDVDDDPVDEQAHPAEGGDQAEIDAGGFAEGEQGVSGGSGSRTSGREDGASARLSLVVAFRGAGHGEVPERLNGRDWKSRNGGNLVRGFESLSLRCKGLF